MKWPAPNTLLFLALCAFQRLHLHAFYGLIVPRLICCKFSVNRLPISPRTTFAFHLRLLPCKKKKNIKGSNETSWKFLRAKTVKVESCVLWAAFLVLVVFLLNFFFFSCFSQLPRSPFLTFPRAMSAAPHQGQLESFCSRISTSPPIPVLKLELQLQVEANWDATRFWSQKTFNFAFIALARLVQNYSQIASAPFFHFIWLSELAFFMISAQYCLKDFRMLMKV